MPMGSPSSQPEASIIQSFVFSYKFSVKQAGEYNS